MDTPRFRLPTNGPTAQVVRIPDFRRYACAQLASGAGTWNQRVAELWLLLELTGDGLSLGVGTALRTAPALFLATPAGWLADRFDRRRLLTLTQGARGLVGVAFAVIAALDAPPLVAVYSMILLLGIVNSLDGPMRRSFVRDVVDRRHLATAAGLHTATISISRVIGPLLAGVVIAVAGVPWAFALSAVTAAVAITCVRSIGLGREPNDLGDEDPAVDGHAARDDAAPDDETVNASDASMRVADVLVILAAFSVLGWNVDVVLPILADSVLGRGPLAFSGLVICLSIGTFIGSVTAAGRRSRRSRLGALTTALVMFGLALPLVAATDRLVVVAAAIMCAGGFGGMFLSEANAAMQLAADPESQGRTVAAYSVVFTGSRALGAPVIGVAIDRYGARPTIAMVGAVTTVAGVAAAIWIAAAQRRRPHA